MKKLLALMILWTAIEANGQGSGWLVTGWVKGVKDTIDKVMLTYRLNGERVTDTALVAKGKFTIRGNFAEPVKAILHVKHVSEITPPKYINYQRDALTIFVQPGQEVVINCLSDSFANAEVKDGVMNTELKKIETGEKAFDDKINPLYQAYSDARKNKNKQLGDSLEKIIDAAYSTKTEEVYGKYIKAHPTSPIAVFVLTDYAGYEIDAEKVEPLFNKLPSAQKNWQTGKDLKAKIDIAKITGIGKIAPEFSQADTLGTPVSLASFRGKYVLLDFWASWCGPCRRENPNVVAAFNKFKEKGFNILGVSLDQPGAKDKWMKAIHDDGLTWTHVSDLKYWDNAVAKQYGIQAIPQNLLIGPDGKIVAKDLRGEDLEKKLAGIFAN